MACRRDDLVASCFCFCPKSGCSFLTVRTQLPPPPLFLAPGPPPVDPLPPPGLAPSGVSQVDPPPGAVPSEVAVDSGAARGTATGGAEPGGAELGGAEPGGGEPEGVEPGGAESEGAESGGAEPQGASLSGGSAGASSRLSPQQLREWLLRCAHLWSGAPGAGGAGVTTGAGVTGGTAATGPGGARTRGTGAAGTGGVGGAGARDPTNSGAAGAGGSGVGGVGAGGAGVGGTGVGGTGTGGAGAGGAGAVDRGGTVRPRPYFVPLLQQVLGVPSSTSLTPPLLCPPPDQSQLPLPPSSPLPAPSPYTEQSGGLTERREPESCPVSLVCTAHRVPPSRPPPVPGTHAMALRPSSVPLHVQLPAPPESSLPEVPDPESDCARAASPTVSRVLATAVTNPSFESTAPSALVAGLLDIAAAHRLDYATSLFAESESASPPSVKGTYVDEVPPHGANIVDGMWIFRVKRPPGSPPAFKAHYVAREFSRRQGVDYFQTFSPTPKMTTLRVLLHVAAQRDYELHSLDFSTAFLQGSLHEEIWLRRPPGFTGSFPTGTQWSLRRPVYGLRQAPREWHDTLRTTLAALGFAPSTVDPSLVLRTDTSLSPFYVPVYVNDLVFATADTEALTLVKSELQKRHTCTDMGELRSYLGLQITRDRAQRTITLTQSHMVHQVLQLFGFHFSSPQPTSLSTGHSLSAPLLDKSVEPSGPYPELVGCLITSGMGLVLGGRGPVVLTGHADASWVDDSATQRPSQGYTFSLGSGSVSWRSTRSSSVLSSSCEAEIYAGAMAAQELRWLTYLLTDLGEQPRSPPVLYVDNKAMIALCQEHRLEHITKHIPLRYFLARELQQRGQLRLAYVATRANTTDIFTKALPPGDHQRFSTTIGTSPSEADPSGGPVLASFSTVLPCPAAPSGSLSGLYLPLFSTNLVSGADLQDQGVDQFTPASQRVTHCTDARTGRHLATFTRRPGSSLYTLSTESPPVSASGQVAASSQVLAAASGSGPESAPCSCRLLSHQTLLWHHRLGHPSLPRLRGMASRVLVSGLPRSLPPLPPGPAPTCVPCVEGRQRAAPHSSDFPPTEAPLQTLHMDVWGPARVRGQGHERYFKLVVDDYSRYTTVFPLRSKGEVTEVLVDWIRAARLRLRESFGSDFPVLRLHSDRGGEFSSARLGAFCRAQGIRQTFTLPASPQQNGIAERRIGMVMDVARTSMIHAAAPYFLWPFAVQYAAHQLNLQPRVSLPETSPTLLWTGKVGDASAFRFWGSRAFVRDLSADKLSPRATPCCRPRLLSPARSSGGALSRPRLRLPHWDSAGDASDQQSGSSQPHWTLLVPDLAYPLSILARYVAPGRHRPEHMAAVKRVLRYLCSTSGMGLVLGGRRPVVLTGHADASWADDQATQRSSSCEAEIYAGAMAAQELHWLTYLLTDLGEQPRSPPVLYVDNKAMLALCREHRLEHRTKHIALRYFLARELQQRGQLRLAYVASEANTADIFTKALAPGDHQRFCTLLGLLALLCLTACFAFLDWSCDHLFSPTLPMGGRPIQFDTWLDDVQLYLLSDSRDSVSLFDHTSGTAPAPPATFDSATRSQWLTRDAAARLAICNHLPLAECAHFGQHRTAHALYDVVVARYSSPATAALGCLLLPYLFPELSAFATVEDLVSHLHISDAHYRAAAPAEFLNKNQPPIFITLYFIVTRLPDSLRSVRDHFLSLDPTVLTIDLLEQHLLATETSVGVVGAARGTPRTPFFEGCSPSPLAPSYASAAAIDVPGTEDVGAASASAKRRSSKGKGGRGGGGGSGGGGVGSSGGGGGSGGGGSSGSGGGSWGFSGDGGGSGGSGGTGSGGSGGNRIRAWGGGSGGGQRQHQQRRSETPGSFPYVIRTGNRAGQTCGKPHTQHRCFSRLDEDWRAEFGDEAERLRRAELLRSGVAIFDLDYDAILSAMYALSISAEGDCYLCVPPNPGIGAAALGASESTLPGTAAAEALHTFTLDSGASRCLHLLSFSTNLVNTAALQDSMVTTTTPGGQRVSICTCTRTGPHLPTFTRRVAPPCLCRLLSHQTLLWHHRLGHPSLPRLRGIHSRLLVSGLPRSLPPLPPSLAPPSLPCVEGRQCAAPHSSSFPPTTASLQTLHMDVWGPARVTGQGRERYFLLVVDDYTHYTMVFPLRSKGEDLPVLCLHSDRGGEFFSDLLGEFCHGEGILQSFTLPASHQQNGIAERRIGLVMEFYHPTLHCVLPSQDVTFDELVPFYRLFPYCSAPLPPLPLFLAPGPPPVDPLPPQGPAPSYVSQVDPPGGTMPGEVVVDSGAVRGAASGGAETGGPAGVSPRLSPRPEPLSPQQLREWFTRRTSLRSGAEGAGSSAAGDAGAGGAGGTGVSLGAGGPGGAGPTSPGGACTGAAGAGGARGAGAGGAAAGAARVGGAGAGAAGGTGATGAGGAAGVGAGGAGRGELREPESRPALLVRTALRVPCPHPPPVPSTHIMALRPSSMQLRVPLPPPPDSSLPVVPDPESDHACAAYPTVSRLLATVVTNPSFESTAASALVAELINFGAVCRLDYATALVPESKFASPPSVGDECALGTDVLEDRQEDFECLAGAVPRFASMLLDLEGDTDIPDIPTPCSYAEAITGPYSSV
ncbi:unnamed protein product [Closterium sp. NIES-53]